jgi:mono/diheme cytochrome c family protein
MVAKIKLMYRDCFVSLKNYILAIHHHVHAVVMLDYLTPYGPFHILILHLPIGGFAALWFSWLATTNRAQYTESKTFFVLNLFLLLSTSLSVATGWLYQQQGAYGAELDLHAISGYVFAGLVASQFIFLIAVRRRPLGFLRRGYYLLVLAASAAMVFTSHLGGELVHGKGFVKKAFRPKKDFVAAANVPATVAARKKNEMNGATKLTMYEDATVASDLQVTEAKKRTLQEQAALSQDFDPFAPIEASAKENSDTAWDPFAPLPNDVSGASTTPPVLSEGMSSSSGQVPAVQLSQTGASVKWDQASAELAHKRFNRAARVMKNHCYSCHGATKVKGGLRLDSKEHALTAGDSGLVSIIPHDAQSSLLIKRMLLPEEHDDVMPPSSKAPVDPDELVALMEWIDAGAIWDTDIVFVPNQQTVRKVQETNEAKGAPELDALTHAGIQYQAMGWGDHRIRVSLTAHSLADLAKKIHVLQAVKERVSWLDLSHSELSEEIFRQLTGFENLERLKLIGAKFSDRALQALSALKALTYLNLYQTDVTDAAIEGFSQIVSLQKIFLAETHVTPAGAAQLASQNSALKVIYR